METVTWSGPRRLARAALIGISLAFAGVAVSVILGVGATSAHADDDRGLTGAVTDLLGGTTSLVGSTVTGVTSTATDVLDAVVDGVPQPAQQPVQAVSQAVATVATPVQNIVSSGVVGAVTQPVVDVLTEVPVVGSVVSGLGFDGALTGIGATLDDTLVTTVGAVSGIGSVRTPATPVLPSPGVDAPDASDPSDLAPASPHALVVATTVDTADERVDAAIARYAASATAFATAPPAASSSFAVVPSVHMGTPVLPVSIGDPCLSIAAPSGPAGAGSGAWALAALLPLVAHRAWVRRAGPGDDETPSAPADSADVSPD